jgi:hypothetical protein
MNTRTLLADYEIISGIFLIMPLEFSRLRSHFLQWMHSGVKIKQMPSKNSEMRACEAGKLLIFQLGAVTQYEENATGRYEKIGVCTHTHENARRQKERAEKREEQEK